MNTMNVVQQKNSIQQKNAIQQKQKNAIQHQQKNAIQQKQREAHTPFSAQQKQREANTPISAQQKQREAHIPFYYRRSRLNELFREAVKYPLVLVCAGAGYGKTSAVLDFISQYQESSAWLQLSELDNVGTRYWKKYTQTLNSDNESFINIVNKLGFPDTDDKINRYFEFLYENVAIRQRILVMDDFHLIENPEVLHVIERGIQKLPPEKTLFMLTRSIPPINIASLSYRGIVYSIGENELRFTEHELTQYLLQQKLSLPPEQQQEIINDTEGWAFAINLIARSYQQAPGYKGYLRNAMKTNVFQLMETEVFDRCSASLQNFLIRLSLIEHLSIDLISLLAEEDEGLISELERQNAYIRRDDQINAYVIHHLFREFLCQKQARLTEHERHKTYQTTADWCYKNGFMIDALGYFEKTGDYASIVSVFFELPTKVPLDIAQYALGIFDRAPAEAFDRIAMLAAMHIRVLICLGLWDEATTLMEQYEARFLTLPEDSVFRNHTLGGIYYCWAILRTLMCTTDDRYDFDLYYARQEECLSRYPVDPGLLANHPIGCWVSLVGSSRSGAPQEYIEALSRAVKHASRCFNGAMSGSDDLARGELEFYRGNIRIAEQYIIQALEQATLHEQYEAIHRALFFTMRCAVAQGDWTKAQKALDDTKELLGIREYAYRFLTYDAMFAWYLCYLDLPEQIPEWLKEKVVPYSHAYFIENFGNQIKARYCYLTRNYSSLLAYMTEQRQRESILYGRVEMLTLEACVHYKMKDRKKAFEVLKEAFEEASGNEIVMPFVELGKDMRTLSAAALKDLSCGIPGPWLETVNRQATTYAKRKAHIIAQYNQKNRINQKNSFTPRELEILAGLAQGLSRRDIASSCNLSVNTVKMVIGNIYDKLGVRNLADLIRVAVEQGLV